MRSKTTGHSNCDTHCAIYKQIRNSAGQVCRLFFFISISQLPINSIFLNISQHFFAGFREFTLCITISCRTIAISATIIAVEVNERISHIPLLAQPNQRSINRAIAVRMETTHRVTNRLSTLYKLLIITITLIEHIPEDSSLDRFQTIFCRRNCSICNNT